MAVSLRKANPVSGLYVEVEGMLFLRSRVNPVRRVGRDAGMAINLSDFRVASGDLMLDGMSPEEWAEAWSTV